MRNLLSACVALGRALVMPGASLTLENAALRRRLLVALRSRSRPQLRPGDRVFRVRLRRLWPDRVGTVLVVKPATVIGWHRRGFEALWRWKSRPGRPRIPRRHIAFIRGISADHPEWGEDEIVEELAAKCGIRHSGSTVRRYDEAVATNRSRAAPERPWKAFAGSASIHWRVLDPAASPADRLASNASIRGNRVNQGCEVVVP